MLWYKKLAILIITLILIIVLFFLINYLNRKKTIDDYASTDDYVSTNHTKFLKQLNEFGKLYFKNFSDKKIVKIPYNSQGLVVDAVIINSALQNLNANPFFYFEFFDNNSTINDWFFVNLDITGFDDYFSKENSPCNICCKTFETYNILKNKYLKKKIRYFGFTSADKFNASIEKNYKKFLHIAGNSPYKGTIDLVKTWISNLWLPILTIIANDSQGVSSAVTELINKSTCVNIILVNSFLSETEINHYFNEHGLHICISEHEGFGHTSNEARSVEAVTLFIDSPLFRERFVDGVTGISVSCVFNGYKNNICPKYRATSEGILGAVTRVLNMTVGDLKLIGINARKKYLQDDLSFKENFLSSVAGKEKIPNIIHNMWIEKDNPYINVEMPNRFYKYTNTWQEQNKNFTFKYWSGKDVFILIETMFPQYLMYYINLTQIKNKCEFARFAILYTYGGVYVDLNLYCMKNIKFFLTGDSFFLKPSKKINVLVGKFCLFSGILGLSKKNKIAFDFLKNIFMTDCTSLEKFYKNKYNKFLFCNTCNFLACDNDYSDRTRTVYLYWVGKEYKLIALLRKLIYLHSTNGKGYKVVLLTETNVQNYIKNIPTYFKDLIPAHKADFVRVNVICDFGGIWLDSDTLVMDSLDSLFNTTEAKDGFFIKENNKILCNGIFGSKPNTPIMLKWKKKMIKILSIKKNTINWAELGNNLLETMYNKNVNLFNRYEIFNGLDNVYPVNWDNCVTEFLNKPYDNYKTIIRQYQPLLVLVNSVYHELEKITKKEILVGNKPLNYFINKSFENVKNTNDIFKKLKFTNLIN